MNLGEKTVSITKLIKKVSLSCEIILPEKSILSRSQCEKFKLRNDSCIIFQISEVGICLQMLRWVHAVTSLNVDGVNFLTKTPLTVFFVVYTSIQLYFTCGVHFCFP